MAYKRRSLALALLAIGVRGPVDPVGAHRPGRVPVPLLHGPAVRVAALGVLHRRALARPVTADLAARPAGRRDRRRPAGGHVAPLPAAVRDSWTSSRSIRVAGLPGGHPRVRPDGPDGRRSRSWPASGPVRHPHGPRPDARRRTTAIARAAGPGARLLIGGGSSRSGCADLSLLPNVDRCAHQRPGRADRRGRRPPAGLPRHRRLRRPRPAPLRGRVRRRRPSAGSWSCTRTSPRCRCRPTVVNAYQGILPTYLYAFQFPVSTDRPQRRDAAVHAVPRRCCSGRWSLTCLVVAYSAWVWRLSLADRPDPTARRTTDGFARSGRRLRDRRPEPGRQLARRPPGGG